MFNSIQKVESKSHLKQVVSNGIYNIDLAKSPLSLPGLLIL